MGQGHGLGLGGAATDSQGSAGAPSAEASHASHALLNGKDGRISVNESQYHVKPLYLKSTACKVFDINLHEGPLGRQNVERYYCLCKDFSDLHVTTSCFTIWRQHKKTNGHAKVIPAVASGAEDAVRIFFFDDNLDWDGHETSPGICNLRDVATGKFVDFGEGVNGFRRDHAARHTVIHHSTEYRNVLVKANILDAMEDPEYFSSIVNKFSQADERIIVFMDVNSTIVCNDTVQGKDLAGTLLSTMFEFIQFRPASPFELTWDSHPPLQVKETKSLKQLVKQITGTNHEAYGAFWTESNCWGFYGELGRRGETRWVGEGEPMSLEALRALFQEYAASVQAVTTEDGIASSWFRVFEGLKGRHTVVLNSFGVDTRKVVLATLASEKRVLQITVNHELWDARDVSKFESQFQSEDGGGR